MIEVLNKLINILVGSSDIDYLLTLSNLKSSYTNFLYKVNSQHVSFDAINGEIPPLDYKLFFPWLFSSPEVIISIIYYLLMAWAIFYFCLIVPYRLIKSLLPKAIRGGKQ